MGIFHRTKWWGFTRASKWVVIGKNCRPGFVIQFSVDRRKTVQSLGGLKSANLEAGFKMFQTIFSAPEKSEHTYT